MRDGTPNRIVMRCARGAQSRGLVDAATTLNVARCDKIRFRPRGAVWARRGAQPNQTDRAGQGWCRKWIRLRLRQHLGLSCPDQICSFEYYTTSVITHGSATPAQPRAVSLDENCAWGSQRAEASSPCQDALQFELLLTCHNPYEVVGSIPAKHLHGFEINRPSSKGTKLPFQVRKAIINQ